MSYRGLAVLGVVVVGWLAGCPGDVDEDDGNVTSTNVSNSSVTTSSSTAASTSASTASAGGSAEGGQGGDAGAGGSAQGGQGGSSQGGSAQGGQGGSSQGGQGGSSQGGSGQGGGMCVATISGDAICDSCLTGNCCTEAATCQGNPNQCNPLYTCTFQACSGDCMFPICDANAMLLVHEACATCLGANCCVEFKACENNMNCMDCISGVSPSACNATTLDDVLEACQMTNCAVECVYL